MSNFQIEAGAFIKYEGNDENKNYTIDSHPLSKKIKIKKQNP